MRNLKILIFGAYSNFGKILSKYLRKKNYRIYKIGRAKNSQVKINGLNSIPHILKEKSPDLIINLIGETNVDFCEKYKERAYEANVRTLEKIYKSKKIHKLNFKLIHISSDQVYSKSKSRLSSKEKDVNPINYYAKSKIRGEKIALKMKSVILRTNFVGKQSKLRKLSFTDWIYLTSLKKKKINGFKNIYFNPLHTSSLCKVIEKIINYKNIYGIFNAGSKKGISKGMFIYQFLKKFKREDLIKLKNYSPSMSIARRPLNMKMNTTKLENKLKIRLPDVNKEILKSINDYL